MAAVDKNCADPTNGTSTILPKESLANKTTLVIEPGLVLHICNPGIWETEIGLL